MRLTRFLVATMLAATVSADHATVYSDCPAIGLCIRSQLVWYTNFASYTLDQGDGCDYSPNIPDVYEFCMDWNNLRGHFRANNQPVRCIRLDAGRLSDPHLYNIFGSTAGIVFFGTPHGGADPRGFLQHVAERLVKAVGISVNEKIVDTLLPSSDRLKQLSDEFGPIAHAQNWMVHSFQEGPGIKYLSGRKVVEDTSSCLNFPLETTQHIDRNHMDMCRFTGANDIEYKKVVAILHRMTTAVTKKPEPAEAELLNESQRKALMEALKFDQMDARQLSVKTAHAKTCRWLLRRPKYLDWIDTSKTDQHHGFLWIKGKPGTGKSTLMKFALANSRKTMKDSILTSFFFNTRESRKVHDWHVPIPASITRLPRLQSIFGSLGFTSWNICGDYVQSVETLKGLFEDAVRLLGEASVVCFIDALDECDEDQVRDMVAFFQRLGESAVSSAVRFHVIFSSRHYPHITIKKGLSLVLEGQEGHSQDITTYISNQISIGHGKISEQIRLNLHEKVEEELNCSGNSGRFLATYTNFSVTF
ncbi:hypothetical protein B0T25DRAFT_583166 [Lasiosphaeria hispida]|uniref:Nephrocystin 3-like N-terminal domain-containing protein n=1 Tax=Lasiosphaeria hispida TaxID=260671 RepID=A0AAJ0HAX7_9PEZI|nr:hypothetical protein B0T25DRAFT_583166 [Lasiosphaeria hispida]